MTDETETSGELAVYRAAWSLAQRVASTAYAPAFVKGKPADTLATLLAGRELGLGPMASLRALHAVNGRVGLSAELMRALAVARGHRIDVVETSAERCTLRGTRADTGATAQVTWTTADQRTAKLTGEAWARYPRAMLAARATGELCRLLFPDVLLGLAPADDYVEPGPGAWEGIDVPPPGVDAGTGEVVDADATESLVTASEAAVGEWDADDLAGPDGPLEAGEAATWPEGEEPF